MTQYATPPRFGTQPLDDDDDDLFATPPRRHGASALVEVQCAVCEGMCRIPVLADGKLCDGCRSTVTAQQVKASLDGFELFHHDAWSRFDAALAHADERDRARYERVVETWYNVQAGVVSRTAYDAKYAEAVARGDGLSVILKTKQAADQAAEQVEVMRGWARRALEEIRAANDVDLI